MVNVDYLYNPSPYVKGRLNKNYFIDKKLGFKGIERATILPHKDVLVNHNWTWGKGGIVDSNGEFIKNSFAVEDRGEKYIPKKEDIAQSSETVIYLGLFYPVWGHCLTDNIRRVWFLKSEFFKSEFKHCPLVYVPWENTPLEKLQNFRRLLEILEVDVDNLRPITQPTQFDKIILPDESFLSPYNSLSSGFTMEYRETIDRVRDFALKNRTLTSSKKIYYFYGRRGIGEERLADYFKSKGYEIISPEKLTLDEQLNLLINAENFIGTLGSIAHNSVFMRDGMEAIFIPRSVNILTHHQGMINQVHPMNINYIDTTLSILGNWNSPHCYIISKQLKEFFGDKWEGYIEDDFKIFLSYIKTYMNQGHKVNPYNLKNYAPILFDFMAQLKQREDLIAAYDMPPCWETSLSILSYQTHVSNKGWGAWISDNQISNPLEQQNDVQAIKIKFPNHKVYYSVYYGDKEGWSQEVSNGEMAGTTGKRKPIYGMRVWLDAAGSKEFDILYCIHKFDGTWTPWAKNGEELYSDGVKLNAIQIKLEPKT